MPAARLRTTTATNEMQNVMWAMLSWANEPRLSNRATKKSSSDRPSTISGVTIGRSSERLGRPVAAEAEPGQAEAEQRAEDGRHDHRDESDLDGRADRREQVVVGQQLAVPVRGEGVPHERPPRIVEREDDQHDDRGEQEREDEHRERGQQRVALAAHRRRPVSRGAHSPDISRRTRRRAMSVPTIVTTIRMNPSADPNGQSRPSRKRSWMTLAMVVCCAPPSRSGCHEVAHRRDEHEQRGGDDAGHRQRQRDVQEGAPPGGVQVARRRHQILVDAVDRDEHRQDRERQEPVGHPEDHREVGVEQDDRLARQPDRLEDRVHDAVVAQDDHPGVGPDQVARPEREHHEDQQQRLAMPAVARDPVGDREADQQRGDRSSARRSAAR